MCLSNTYQISKIHIPPFLLDFRWADMDAEWFATVWRGTSHPFACSADFPIVWNAERLRGHLILCTRVCLVLINQKTTHWSWSLGSFSKCKNIYKSQKDLCRGMVCLTVCFCCVCRLAGNRRGKTERSREIEIWSWGDSESAEDTCPMKGQGQGGKCADQSLWAPGPSFLLIIKSAPIYICGKQTFSQERMEAKSANYSAFRASVCARSISFLFYRNRMRVD